MAPKSKDNRARLLEPLATDMAAFREAIGMGVTEIGVIRDAVRAYIDTRIAADADLRTRYEAERERLRATQRQPIRLVRETNGD
jgi:hypothetical protein